MTILGLDLGTNSIGWALIQKQTNDNSGNILGMGSRIIPMSQDMKDDFGKGNSISQTADRTNFRSVRRLRERHLLRRERLHRILRILNFLPKHYADQIDFDKRFGQFKINTEPKLAYSDKVFIFKQSFEMMLADFRENQPEALKDGKLIPQDWTIYYLRKRALTEKIQKEELAWILLNFNQKRGYYQLRGDEEEDHPNKLVEFHSLKVVDVIADDTQKGKSEIWYSLILENGWIYRRSSKIPLFDWKDKVRDFIVTTDLNDDGSIKTDKEGNEKRSFRAPGEDDWTLLKKKTEKEIINSHQTVGTYIYDALLQNPKQKIKGDLIRTIERKFYKEELSAILRAQQRFHPELKDENLYNDCVRELYRNNESHQRTLSTKGFMHLIVEDLIFHQRPLRSQKSSIGNCSFEYRRYTDKDGIEKTQYLKAIPKSHPLYQEFRLWQWIYNLSVYDKNTDFNVTSEFLNSVEEVELLFEFLNTRKEIEQKPLLKYLLEKQGLKDKELSLAVEKYRWNYVEDKKYPCNETRTQIKTKFEKVVDFDPRFLTTEVERSLWHIIYSVTDKSEYEKSLKTFAQKHHLDVNSFVESFRKIPPFPSEYGSFSEKAITKLLSLMRVGKYWDWDAISEKTKNTIQNILTGEFDETLKERIRNKALHLTDEQHFQGLQLWLASYIIYGRHAEAASADKWNSVADLETYLMEFKQHSLRNPIVEQVVTETLRVVKDIWLRYGNGAKDFFTEIHVELGRDMKNTAEERNRISQQVTTNENTNLRIKALLGELLNDTSIENVRPYSPMQQEALKIFEDGVLNSSVEVPDDILKISKAALPTTTELQRYKLWLEQKYRSPYTGKIIPLNKLFTAEYEIEHIIPQSRFFDDSFSNKIICESSVNKLKDKQLGYEFIKNHSGAIIGLGFGKSTKLFSLDEYVYFINEHYGKNRGKRNKLLLEEIPDKMIERQLNDTRYISKFITSILSNIVRAEVNDDGVNSKNVLPGNGKITSRLRQDWGLGEVWNELILPRFERMNKLTDSTEFTAWSENHQKFLPVIPFQYSKGFQKKRIDHRHHAVDALVIACATRDHVNLLNNKHAKSKERFDLNRKLRVFEKTAYSDPKTDQRIEKEVPKDFLKPWATFTVDAKNHLEMIVVSFKQNLRVINKTTNHHEKWVDRDGVRIKERVSQSNGDSWAIRRPMHKDTVSGIVILDRIKPQKGKILTATRKFIDSSFNIKTIEYITDTGIQKILKNYLESKDNDPEMAFSAEGIEDMNKNISQYNDGKFHQPIYKARIFEMGSKFPLGQSGNKKDKYVEAAKGTNLFFAVYQDDQRKRSFDTVPLNIVIERQKQGLSSVPLDNTKGGELLFQLSPNDLVYVPTEEELSNPSPVGVKNLSKIQIGRIYKMVSSSGNQCFFLKHETATTIVYKGEYSALNKMERSLDGLMIKEVCVKLNVDRIGQIG